MSVDDVLAFEPLFRKLAFGDTEEDREDSFADIRAHVMSKLGAYRQVDGHGFASWVTTVARNRACSLMRQSVRSSRRTHSSGLHLDASSDPSWFAEFAVVHEAMSVPGCVPAKKMPWELVDAPPPNWVNTGLSPCSPKTLSRYLGMPSNRFNKNCGEVDASFQRHLVTANVGPFRVTGEKLAVASLASVMADVKEDDPALYQLLGSAGMLCVRHVRGLPGVPSNHSWGTAIDLTIGGRLDPRGDKQCQQGLLRLYKHFHRHGWFWGVAFRVEDAMHFEIANETAHRLYARKNG